MTPLVDALRGVPLLNDLTESQLSWLVGHVEDLTYEAGDTISNKGDPADYLIVVLEGEIQARSPNVSTYIAAAGTITGLLPQSRMTVMSRAVSAAVRTRIARLHRDHFEEMLSVIPQLSSRLLGVMADRIRDVTRNDIQQEKL